MAYDEEQRKRSRVVVETPAARREVVETEVARVEPERRGMSTGAVAALVVGAVALVTILFLFLLNRQQMDNTNVRVSTAPTPVPQTTIIQQPAPVTQQPPIVIQQPPATTTTTTQPIVVPAPATSTSTAPSTETSSSGTDDATVQSNIDRKISEDPNLGSLGVIAAVVNGRVTLTGTVDKAEQKRSVERLVKSVKGVKAVDNQITVSGATESPTSP